MTALSLSLCSGNDENFSIISEPVHRLCNHQQASVAKRQTPIHPNSASEEVFGTDSQCRTNGTVPLHCAPTMYVVRLYGHVS